MTSDAIVLTGIVILTAAALVWTFWGSHRDGDGE